MLIFFVLISKDFVRKSAIFGTVTVSCFILCLALTYWLKSKGKHVRLLLAIRCIMYTTTVIYVQVQASSKIYFFLETTFVSY